MFRLDLIIIVEDNFVQQRGALIRANCANSLEIYTPRILFIRASHPRCGYFHFCGSPCFKYFPISTVALARSPLVQLRFA